MPQFECLMSWKEEDVLHGASASEGGNCGRKYLCCGEASMIPNVTFLVCTHCDNAGDYEVCDKQSGDCGR